MSVGTPELTAQARAPRRDPHDAEPADDPLTGAECAHLFDRAFGARKRVALAVSGGADSTALLVLAAEWAHKRDAPALFVATVDHGLRAEAAAEIEAVARLAADFDIPHAVLSAPLPNGSARIEETARNLRYAARVRHARSVGADALATAHTLDDQAETVLMRLAAGSGPAGLAAMRPESKRGGLAHLRPFLTVPKARLVATLQARVMQWSEDVMNADPRFARARLRAGRAALVREGLTPARLATLAFRMARLDAAVEQAVDAAAEAHVAAESECWRLAPEAGALPDEIKLRLLGRAVAAVGGGKPRLDRLERLADQIVTRPSGAATLAGARVSWTPDGAVTATPAPPRGR